MDRDLRRASFWCTVVVFVSLSRLADGRPVRGRGSGVPGWTRGDAGPRPAAGPGVRPRAVAVNCRPDSMEVVVQADVFGTGLEVHRGHLRLGSGSASAGSACGAAPHGEAEFIIHAHLMDCGTKLSVSDIF